MTASDDLRAFAHRWRELGPKLLEMEREELQEVDIAATIRAFTGAALVATRANPEVQPATSGLVEFHRIVQRLHA